MTRPPGWGRARWESYQRWMDAHPRIGWVAWPLYRLALWRWRRAARARWRKRAGGRW